MRNCLVVGCVVFVVGMLGGCGGEPPEDPVPDIVGMELADAEDALSSAGYDADVDDQSDSLDFNTDNNKVCSTEPAAGEKGDSDQVKLLVKSDADDCKTAEQKAAEEAEAAKNAPRVVLSRKRSYCEQLGTVYDVATVGTQIKVVLWFKNTGKTDAEGISYMVRRTYQNGKEVDPVGDMVVDVKVPADGRLHPYRINYEVGANYQVVGCTVHDVDGVPALEGKEIELRVENSITDF